MLATNLGFWDHWEDSIKVTFDGLNRLIFVNEGEASIDMKEDVYSPWKRWASRVDNSKWYSAVRSVGGDTTPTGYVGDTYFLTNGWRLQARPIEAGGSISLIGILYTEEGDSPIVPVSGMSFEFTVSNLATGTITEVLRDVIIETIFSAETSAIINQTLAEATLARQHQSNKAVISNDGALVTIYADDGTTILHQFDVTDSNNVRTPR